MSFCLQFWASRYIMCLKHTLESKVMADWTCRDRTCWILGGSIYYEPESDIQVKSFNHLNFSRAFTVHFQASRSIMALTHTPNSKVMTVWIFWELPCTILRVSIYYEPESDILVKSYDHLNFSRASIVHLRASRFIMGLTHTPESEVMAVWICETLHCQFQASWYIMCLNWRSEWNFMFNF